VVGALVKVTLPLSEKTFDEQAVGVAVTDCIAQLHDAGAV
jgi:hypothetical protein